MKNVTLILLSVVLTACNQAQEKRSSAELLISDVNIVDVRTGVILENQQVIIDSGKIKTISNDIDSKINFSETIDGSGKYLLPGLAEMHAHIPPPSTDAQRINDVLFLYLSNGITTIRGMLGDPAHLKLR